MFAVVFRLECQYGRKWAVRCFIRDLPDQQRRYASISDKLNSAKLPYSVGFEYLSNGIRVNGKWYPVLKMEWVEGISLFQYVEQNLSKPQNIQALTKQWIEMMAALRGAKIAHGDLQHGNIVVCNGALKLIDYDGMYVPALKGMQSNEQGHPNYQHPRRSGADFNENLDNFSAWLIFISLSTFAIEPRLWRSLNCGDEHLLFRRTDLERPASSNVFRALDTSGKPQLQSLAAHLRSLLCLPLKDIPALDGLPVQTTSRRVIGGRPDWLSDHVPEEKLESLQQKPPAPHPVVTGADWIFDHLVTEPVPLPVLSLMAVSFERRVLLLGCIIGTALSVFAATSHALLTATLMIVAQAITATVFLRIRFKLLSVVDDGKKVFAKIIEGHRAVTHIEDSIQTVNGERLRTMEPLAELDQRYRTVPQRLANALLLIQRGLDASLSDLALTRAAVDQTELEELSRVESSHLRIRTDLLTQRNAVRSNEQAEISSAVSKLRQLHVYTFLCRHNIRLENIPGISRKLVNKLIYNGFQTAADVDSRVYSVRGIGQARGQSLLSWRQSVEWRANQSVPTELPAYETSVIKSKYARQLQELDTRIAESAEAQVREHNRIADAYMSERHQLIQQEEALRHRAGQDEADARAKYRAEKEQLALQFRSEESKAIAVRKDLDAKLAELSHSVFKRRAEIHQLQREYARYRGVTFKGYVRKIFGIRAAA